MILFSLRKHQSVFIETFHTVFQLFEYFHHSCCLLTYIIQSKWNNDSLIFNTVCIKSSLTQIFCFNQDMMISCFTKNDEKIWAEFEIYCLKVFHYISIISSKLCSTILVFIAFLRSVCNTFKLLLSISLFSKSIFDKSKANL